MNTDCGPAIEDCPGDDQQQCGQVQCLAKIELIWLLGLTIGMLVALVLHAAGFLSIHKFHFFLQISLYSLSVLVNSTLIPDEFVAIFGPMDKWNSGTNIACGIVQIFLHTSMVALLASWIFGLDVFGGWVGLAVGVFTFLILGGTNLESVKEGLRDNLEKKLGQANINSPHLISKADELRSLFNLERIVYLLVPLGLFVGGTGSLALDWSPQMMALLALNVVLTMVATALFIFVIVAGKKMLSSLVDSDSLTGQSTTTHYALAALVTDLRDLYLYNFIHDLFLAILLTEINLALLGISTNFLGDLLVLIILGSLICLVPFYIGQSRLHGEILGLYPHDEQDTIREELEKRVPFYPRFKILGPAGRYIVGMYLSALAGAVLGQVLFGSG